MSRKMSRRDFMKFVLPVPVEWFSHPVPQRNSGTSENFR